MQHQHVCWCGISRLEAHVKFENEFDTRTILFWNVWFQYGRLLILFFHLFPEHLFVGVSCFSGTFVYIRSVSVIPMCSQAINHWWGSPHAKQIGRDLPKMVIDTIVNGLGSTPIDHWIGFIYSRYFPKCFKAKRNTHVILLTRSKARHDIPVLRCWSHVHGIYSSQCSRRRAQTLDCCGGNGSCVGLCCMSYTKKTDWCNSHVLILCSSITLSSGTYSWVMRYYTRYWYLSFTAKLFQGIAVHWFFEQFFVSLPDLWY